MIYFFVLPDERKALIGAGFMKSDVKFLDAENVGWGLDKRFAGKLALF